jgi:hypothetical protein
MITVNGRCLPWLYFAGVFVVYYAIISPWQKKKKANFHIYKFPFQIVFVAENGTCMAWY